MSPCNYAALVALRKSLKLNVSMDTGLNDMLEKEAGGFMNRSEAQKVRGLPSDMKQIDKVVEILCRKGDEDFRTFCKILRESNNGIWASELEGEAQRRGMCRGQKYNSMLTIMPCLHQV